MPLPWLAMMAAGATLGFAKKLYLRHRHGTEIPQIFEDPPDVRTLVRFVLTDLDAARDVLGSVGAVLAPAIDGWVATRTTILARHPNSDLDVEVLRLVDRGDAIFTLELTRAWTGANLGEPTRAMLTRIHDALSHHDAVRDLTWHWRQDRSLAIAHPVPVAPALLGV